MNRYSFLDNLFPTVPDRKSGEVVCIILRTKVDDREIGTLQWKRKQWYVNASVNAWHLHRGLCHDLNLLLEANDLTDRLSRRVMKALRKELSFQVAQAYLINYQMGEQYFEVELSLYSPPLLASWFKSLKLTEERDWGVFWTDPTQLEDVMFSDLSGLDTASREFLKARAASYLDNHGMSSGYPGALW